MGSQIHNQQQKEDIFISGIDNPLIIDFGKSLKSFNDCRSSKQSNAKGELEYLNAFRKFFKNHQTG